MNPAVVIIILVVVGAAVLAAVAVTHVRRQQRDSRASTVYSLDVVEIPEQIRALFTTAHERRSTLKIRLNNRGQSFSSSIIAITPRELFIDALFPYEGNELITDSSFLSVEFIIRTNAHVPYRCTSSFIEKITYKEYPALKISLPKKLQRDQKRNYHRVEPSVNEPVFIKFAVDGKLVEEKVANISGGGIGFYTNLGPEILSSQRRVEAVEVTLPDKVVINCISIIHTLSQSEYPVLIGGRPYHFYCGSEFAELDGTTRDKIIRYAIEKEREELKRMNRTS